MCAHIHMQFIKFRAGMKHACASLHKPKHLWPLYAVNACEDDTGPKKAAAQTEAASEEAQEKKKREDRAVVN